MFWKSKKSPLRLYPFIKDHLCPKCNRNLLTGGIHRTFDDQEYLWRLCYGCDARISTEVCRPVPEVKDA